MNIKAIYHQNVYMKNNLSPEEQPTVNYCRACHAKEIYFTGNKLYRWVTILKMGTSKDIL